jgi:hypothetical protein
VVGPTDVIISNSFKQALQRLAVILLAFPNVDWHAEKAIESHLTISPVSARVPSQTR